MASTTLPLLAVIIAFSAAACAEAPPVHAHAVVLDRSIGVPQISQRCPTAIGALDVEDDRVHLLLLGTGSHVAPTAEVLVDELVKRPPAIGHGRASREAARGKLRRRLVSSCTERLGQEQPGSPILQGLRQAAASLRVRLEASAVAGRRLASTLVIYSDFRETEVPELVTALHAKVLTPAMVEALRAFKLELPPGTVVLPCLLPSRDKPIPIGRLEAVWEPILGPAAKNIGNACPSAPAALASEVQ